MTDRKMAALEILGRHQGGFDEYPNVLHMLDDLGHGRLAMMQWQVIFQHMLIIRRTLAQNPGFNFHDTEVKANQAVKRLRILEEPQVHWMLVFAYFCKEAGNPLVWTEILTLLKS